MVNVAANGVEGLEGTESAEGRFGLAQRTGALEDHP